MFILSEIHLFERFNFRQNKSSPKQNRRLKSILIFQVLKLIGLHCHNIQTLDIRNTPITENGLRVLCYDEETESTLCQNLQKLLVQGCHISPYCVSYLLYRLPTLQYIDYTSMFQVGLSYIFILNRRVLDEQPGQKHVNIVVELYYWW